MNMDRTITESRSQLVAPSAPALAKISEEVTVKAQISAPSYLFSLRENGAPPFRPPGKENCPRLLIGTIFNEAEVIEMVAAGDSNGGMKNFIGKFLVDKKIIENFNLSEKNFLTSLILEAIDYAAQRDFSAFKLSVLLTIYLDSHVHFKRYYWSPPVTVWLYFEENMIRHTVEDSPHGQEVFAPEECYDILTHFHTVYLSCLPLVHLVSFGAHRLRFGWPFKLKP